MGKCLSQTLSRRQNEIQLWEADRGTLTCYGWSRTEATPGKKRRKKKQFSSSADEKSSLGSYRWIALTKTLIVCFVWKELGYDTMKSYHRQQSIRYYVFNTVKQKKMAGWNCWLRCHSSVFLPILTVFEMGKKKIILLVWCTALQKILHYWMQNLQTDRSRLSKKIATLWHENACKWI